MPGPEAAQPALQFDAFLSYCRADEAIVVAVQKALEARQLRVWRDADQIQGGEAFIKKLESGLSQSRSVVLFHSGNAHASEWVQREWNVALTLNLRIITIRLDNTELPLFLKTLEFIELPDAGALEAVLERIAAGIRGATVAAPVPVTSNPSVLGKDVVVLERMIANERDQGRRLSTARWAATALIPTVTGAAALVAARVEPVWAVMAAVGSLAVTGGITWAMELQVRSNRSEVSRLIGIKDGIELYCPSQTACLDFRVKLESIVKRRAGL
jgi:hypothetical protein